MEVPKPVRMGYEDRAVASPAAAGDDLWELHAAGTRLLEFTAGRTRQEYESGGVLHAAVAMLLQVMAGAASRIQAQAPEMAAGLERLTQLQQSTATTESTAPWDFVSESLSPLVTSAAEELGRWHEG